MNGLKKKLEIKLRDKELAGKLFDAGLTTPAKLRSAKDSELDRVVGFSGRQKVRKKCRPNALAHS